MNSLEETMVTSERLIQFLKATKPEPCHCGKYDRVHILNCDADQHQVRPGGEWHDPQFCLDRTTE